MRLEKTVSRKLLPPWYDSDVCCLVQILAMGAVFAFSLAGISVVRETPQHHAHLWVPAVLAVLSGGLVISTSIRMFLRKYFRRASR
jgi:hypothetical protein